MQLKVTVMPEYIRYFKTESSYQDKRTHDYQEPWLSYTAASGRVDYNKVQAQ